MNKAFTNFTWENDPSVNTPLSAENLNKVNTALNEIDNRVVTYETTKANKSDMYNAITGVSIDENTGIFTFTRHNGTTFTVDTNLEKVVMNWNFDKETQTLHLILQDGTELPVDLSAFITNVEFADSSTIRKVINTDGTVSFEIIDGTITADKLEPNYLANVQLYAGQAMASATNAKESEDNAEASALRAEEAAEKAQGAVSGDFATNAKVDAIIDGTTPVEKANTATNAEQLGGVKAELYALLSELAKYLPLAGGNVAGSIFHKVGADSIVDRYTNDVAEFQIGVWSDGWRGIYDSTTEKNIIRVSPGNSLVIDGYNTPFHSGNKPTGTYTGSGSSTSRTIDTKGIGNVCIITSQYGVAIVTEYGAIVKSSSSTSLSGLSASTVSFKNGVLTIAGTSNYVNSSSYTYTYNVV